MSETNTTPVAEPSAPAEITPEIEKNYWDTRGGEIDAPKPAAKVARVPAPKPTAAPAGEDPGRAQGGEQQEEPSAAPDARQEPHVPPARLREEADKRRAAETALAAANAEHARQMQLINERLAALQQPPMPEPTLESDPAAFIQRQQAEIAELKQAEAQRQQQNQQVQYVQQIEARARTDVQAYMVETPDYQEAENHLMNARATQLQHLGVPAQQISAMIKMEALHIAEQVFQQGRPLGETIYNLAKSMGYAKKVAQPVSNEEDVDTVAQKMATIERGQRLAAGVPRGSAPPTGQISAQQLSAMTPDEFEAFRRRAPARFKQLMGGP